jgi:hypothetical protein
VAETAEAGVSGVEFFPKRRRLAAGSSFGICQEPLTVALSANGSNRAFSVTQLCIRNGSSCPIWVIRRCQSTGLRRVVSRLCVAAYRIAPSPGCCWTSAVDIPSKILYNGASTLRTEMLVSSNKTVVTDYKFDSDESNSRFSNHVFVRLVAVGRTFTDREPCSFRRAPFRAR